MIIKSNKEKREIIIDDITKIIDIPLLAWEYKLGNKSILDWVLGQYKEDKFRDDTIPKEFNDYHFADYKEELISLLDKLVWVSVKTMEITRLMKDEER